MWSLCRTGTCSVGSGGIACAACIKINEVKGNDFVGLPCGICGGIDLAEPSTERINKRVPALLGFLVVFFLIMFVVVSAILKSEYFNAVLAFAGPLIGLILGYYFSSRDASGVSISHVYTE